MVKNSFKQIKNVVIGTVIAAIIVGAFAWLFGLRQDILVLQRKYSYLVGYLSGRDRVNLTGYFDVSSKKTLNQKQVLTGAHLLTSDPSEAKTYLEHKLKFTSAEAKRSLSPPSFIKLPYSLQIKR